MRSFVAAAAICRFVFDFVFAVGVDVDQKRVAFEIRAAHPVQVLREIAFVQGACPVRLFLCDFDGRHQSSRAIVDADVLAIFRFAAEICIRMGRAGQSGRKCA